MFLLVTCVAGLGALPGCVSTGMARTVDPGKLQVSLSGGLQGNVSYIPQGELAVRYGVTERVDVGARLFLPGAEVDARFALLRAPSLKSGVDVTLAPSLAYVLPMSSTTPGLVFPSLPLLVGFNLGGSQLVLGPRVGYVIKTGQSLTSQSFDGNIIVGSSLGLAIPIGQVFRIVPEVSLLHRAGRSLGSGETALHGGIGLVFGGYAAE
ncbi:hypothetical protein BO221_00275 [Archangium sp. Cb G35]|nr:hypothetical protein BO221_00275 [Archangium sp. Cb G35]